MSAAVLKLFGAELIWLVHASGVNTPLLVDWEKYGRIIIGALPNILETLVGPGTYMRESI
jgi:hypothetical protein